MVLNTERESKLVLYIQRESKLVHYTEGQLASTLYRGTAS